MCDTMWVERVSAPDEAGSARVWFTSRQRDTVHVQVIMEPVWSLAFLSLAMFVGCYLAGSIPLVLSLSEAVMRRVTTFGAGLLVGTALTVIIPEGVESLFEAWHTNQQNAVEGGPEGGAPAAQPAVPANADPPPARHQPVISEVADKDGGLPAAALAAVKAHLIDDNAPAYTEERLFFIMGVALVVGFIFMLLVDQMVASSHSHRPSSLDNDTRGPRRNLTATIGLVVHAAADGLALGAAAGLSKTDVEMVIFVAIMLHKAPAAFGFTSFLIHEGFDKRTAKVHLLVFALAAPVAAFVAYFGLVKIVTVVQAPLTGIAMLFSAGTFLYVATVHVLSELTTTRSSSGEEHNTKLSRSELVLVVSGALLPLLFNVFHSH